MYLWTAKQSRTLISNSNLVGAINVNELNFDNKFYHVEVRACFFARAEERDLPTAQQPIMERAQQKRLALEDASHASTLDFILCSLLS